MASISVVAKNTCTTVGESPFWDPSSQKIWYVDIKVGDVHTWDSATGQDTKVHIEGDEPVGFVIPCTTGNHVVGLGRTLSKVNLATGKVLDRLAEVDLGTQNRFNDGKCDPSGRLWAGTMGHDDPPGSGKFLPHLGSLFSLGAGSIAIKHLDKLTIANGMAWSADASSMFFIDTPERKIYAFDFDNQKGTISNQRVLVDFNDIGPASEVGNPDGMCIDASDNLWVACFGGGRVKCFDSKSGREWREITFAGAKQITCCCFGGQDYTDLYVTSARVRLTQEEFEKNQPDAGSLFKVTDLGGVKGRPAVPFAG